MCHQNPWRTEERKQEQNKLKNYKHPHHFHANNKYHKKEKQKGKTENIFLFSQAAATPLKPKTIKPTVSKCGYTAERRRNTKSKKHQNFA